MSTTAARTLVSLRYGNTLQVDGGMRAWGASGHALERSQDVGYTGRREEGLAKHE